ncbi:DUF4810 domain-containing protein [Aquitalea aquatica]|nr:DUF4810 domain-containing protein [Aquitalea magnusonii]
MMKANTPRLALLVAACSLLAACAQAPKTLYQWEGYQPQVYEHFKGQSPQQQITELEKGLERIAAKGNVPPPGYRAHLGMLYAETGRDDLALQQLQAEKAAFPESAVYIDFLLKKYQK